MKPYHILFLIPFLFLNCRPKTKVQYHPEFETYFKEYQVDGSFLLFDFVKNKTLVYNENRSNEGYLPASTFKIVHTLIGLETGIITGADFVIPWDSVSRQIPAWNKDHKVQSAFQNSVVPWYQELARRIGYVKMQHWVTKTEFGEMDIHKENVDLFWLAGESRITPLQQLDFQKRFINNEIPFSKKDIDFVKEIMIFEETPAYILRGKTGWAVMNNKNIGWLVGYLENDSGKYAYVLHVESADEDVTLFQKSRKEITFKILKQLSLM